MSFKKIAILALLMVNSITSIAQESNNIAYDFLIVNENKKISKRNYESLIDKVRSIYQGKVSFSNQSPFTVIPGILITEQINAGEMQQNMLLKVEITLEAKDIDNNIVFNTYRKMFTVVGANNDIAISKAINQVRANDTQLQDFFVVANNNIIKFYKENCNKILASAKTNIERKEFVRAFSFLKYIPEDISCFKEVEALITKIYIDSKDETCKKILQQAHILEAKEDYNKALQLLKYVDPVTTCYKDVTSLLQQIGKKVNIETYNDFEMEKLKFSKLTDLQKMKILAENADLLTVNVNN